MASIDAAGAIQRVAEIAGLGLTFSPDGSRMALLSVPNLPELRAAEQMPAEEYAFQPTPEVRTFGQLIAHIANANYNYCSIALGTENPNTANIEQTITDKAGLVNALAESFAHCDKAYAIDEMKAHETTSEVSRARARARARTRSRLR